MKQLLPTTLALAFLIATASGQNFDQNGPRAGLTINGVLASAGTALHDVNVQTPGSLNVAVSSGSNTNAGIIMLASLADPTGPNLQTPWGGSLDIGTGTQGIVLVADGVGLSANPVLDGFFNTGSTGNLGLSLSVGTERANTRLAIQAIVRDPVNSPFFFDNTEMADLNFLAPPTFITFTGDDVLMPFTLPSGPQQFCGVTTTAITVSTNGWVKWGVGATSADFSETAAELINGTTGGGPVAPVVACLWEDLDMGNGVAGQEVRVDEVAPGIIEVSWINGDYFPATPFGTVRCIIDTTFGLARMEYDGYTLATPPTEGIVGVSCATATNPIANDLFDPVAGSTNFLFGTGADAIFQSFDGLGTPAVPAEPMDLAGRFINFPVGPLGIDYF